MLAYVGYTWPDSARIDAMLTRGMCDPHEEVLELPWPFGALVLFPQPMEELNTMHHEAHCWALLGIAAHTNS